MSESHVRGLGTQNSDGEYIALINCSDLVAWLRSPDHNLTIEERNTVIELADMIEIIGRDILHRDCGV